jgi:predicted nuclease of predicted toxin-antitoxin system
VVVTLDADFHALLALSQTQEPSIVRIRMEGLRAEEFSILLQNVLARCRADLETGALVSVQGNRVRVRRLPIT